MKRLLCKFVNAETIKYIVFGVLTTIISYVSFAAAVYFMGEDMALIANIISFIFAVTFAYITNKLYVFDSKSWAFLVLRREIPAFLSARLFSFGFEELGLFICVHLLNAGQYALFGLSGVNLSKIVLSVFVVIINYVISKFFIFKKVL